MARQLTLVPASCADGGSILVPGVPPVCHANAASGAASFALTDRKAA
jgi:hypothetical protein